MLHGDISNRASFNIGFRCENTLLIPKKGFSLSGIVRGKWKTADVNEEVYSVMRSIYWDTEYTVSLVVDESLYKSRGFKEYIEDFPFNQSFTVIKKLTEVTSWLNTGLLTYFVTNDVAEKSLINSRYAVTLEEFRREFNGSSFKRKGHFK